MKNLIFLPLTIFILLFGFSSSLSQGKSKMMNEKEVSSAATPDIKGAWEMVSFKAVENGTMLYELPGNLKGRNIKIWSDNYFNVVGQYNWDGGSSDNFVAGTYSLKGDNYSEKVIFHSRPEYKNSEVNMILKIKGDTLIHIWPVDTSGETDKNNFNIEKYVRLD